MREGETAPLARDGLTDDGFLGSRLHILQPKKGYRAGMDAVMLAAAVPANAGERVLEAGLGSGVAALCLLWRCPEVALLGVERNPDMASLARENADRNGFQDRLRIVEADFAASSLFAGAGPLAGRTFDHACANPPFFERGRVREAGNPGKAGAHAGAPGLIGDWASHLVGAVRPGGTVTMILPPAALEEVLAGLRRRAGGISLYPLYPRAGAPATRLLIRAVNGSRAPLRIHAGMVLHEADGAPTGEAEAILRHGRAIEALALGDLG